MTVKNKNLNKATSRKVQQLCSKHLKKSMGMIVFVTNLKGHIIICVHIHLETQNPASYLKSRVCKSSVEKTTTFRCHLNLPAQRHASTSRLLPHVFSQPCQSGFNLKPRSVPSLSFPSPLVHLSRSWRTGLRLCPSTRSWGSPCQLNWMNCIRVWVNTTGLKMALQRRAQISHQPQLQPLQTLPAWRTMAPRTPPHLTPLNCCTNTVDVKKRKTALNPSHTRTG